MSPLRSHFESCAVDLSGRASVEIVEQEGVATLTLRPRAPTSVGVVLFLHHEESGTVALDDPACAPVELGDDPVADIGSIDYFISVAVEGRATAFHLGRGGCLVVREGKRASRSWHNTWPWPGWRRRAESIEYQPYS